MGTNINIYMITPPLVSLLAGIAILIWPRLLSYIVAFYLILFGVVGLLPFLL
ncbi:MAG: DUF3096 domain-containing protein [Chromatiales bacterium]|jgi:hypothetical protein